MKTVYKYKFPIQDEFTINLPLDAKILTAFCQEGNTGKRNRVACLWAEVDTDNNCYPVKFVVAGTGHPLPENREWIATFPDGPFIWHLYKTWD